MNFKNQKELFQHIWDTRDHVSEVSEKPLFPEGHCKWHWQFAHILPKGSYPAYKLRPENILLMLPEEHENQNDFAVFNEEYQVMKAKYYEEIYGKKF